MRRRLLASPLRLAAAALLGAAVALPGVGVAAADTLVLTGGRTLQGRVLQEDERGVVFESFRHGARLRQSVPAAQIASIARTAREGLAVAVIPLIGGVGLGTGTPDEPAATAAGLERALRVAQEERAARIVLVVDSPGGRIDEMQRMLALLLDPELPPVTAYARRALSAAAVIALACDELVVAPEAVVGAAVPLRLGPEGTPQNIEAKYRSGYDALLRQVARRAGRDPDLLMAMADERVVLYEEPAPRGPRLTGRPAGAVFKAAGEILTLTAAEAVRLGVARAGAASVAALPAAVGWEAWHSVGHRAWEEAGRVNAAEADALERAARRAAAEVLRQRLSPALAEAEAALAERERAIAGLHAERERVDAWARAQLAAHPAPPMSRRRSAAAERSASLRADIRLQHGDAAARIDAALVELTAQRDALRQQIAEALEALDGLRG
ncbi:Clp protease/crotonase-like domain-containing protein [Phycisphaera mikurensis]|uniref:NfeD1b N-terminal domain-containing protein n=1 Tax=Phycisphaera mikurensis (strain NBRC 102666 / KCTC 22515 / FYK2301M01) TaxID=1142394 RepID=I0IBH2_PHYMF|nr:hypothetical protein [Phycisphaera mikurensis]MBB6442858.1 membrane-bound serine protease (ClpP class) [Phycisphaera mikurensis]BAM02610.1 hypothetical protein PSMK_04510 [Phycisphaera mikurensis NBRC 102666]